MLETFQVADRIESCIKTLSNQCLTLEKVGNEKVIAEVEYDKEFAIALEYLSDTPVTTRDKRAKGILAKNGVTERLKMAEIRYKALHTKIDAAKSALDGWRSYNRHLDIGVK